MNNIFERVYLAGMGLLGIIWMFYSKEIFFKLLVVMTIAHYIEHQNKRLNKNRERSDE